MVVPSAGFLLGPQEAAAQTTPDPANAHNGARRRVASMERVTNAIKDTVSVLYWYEELSSSITGNFWNGSSELFFVFVSFLLGRVGGVCAYGAGGGRLLL